MDRTELIYQYLLHLADNSLILGQRNAEWCGHGPVLEQDIAITNISLDLFGEARNLFQYAAELKGGSATEDSIAFLRDELKYKNLLLLEQPNVDWAHTIVRQFFFDVFHVYVLTELQQSTETKLVEIASKSIKEAKYHLKWSSEWMIRLGDGTQISHDKMQEALNNLWEYTGEFFMPTDTEIQIAEHKIGPSLKDIQPKWMDKVEEIIGIATLKLPDSSFSQKGGKNGYHSEHLGYLLAEMQYLQRAFPGANW
jgi:ring-1,2-phenylacetyl-CoA epoxidase subunit PaaC